MRESGCGHDHSQLNKQPTYCLIYSPSTDDITPLVDAHVALGYRVHTMTERSGTPTTLNNKPYIHILMYLPGISS